MPREAQCLHRGRTILCERKVQSGKFSISMTQNDSQAQSANAAQAGHRCSSHMHLHASASLSALPSLEQAAAQTLGLVSAGGSFGELRGCRMNAELMSKQTTVRQSRIEFGLLRQDLQNFSRTQAGAALLCSASCLSSSGAGLCGYLALLSERTAVHENLR